ncbi:unnamed protein product [Calicophoron daubneyi]|uniref:Uncharacterized protein n=1 Tax=Calicophoron daubneyi TaxID=300641 RepID=A0AAV2TDM7_CALDB
MGKEERQRPRYQGEESTLVLPEECKQQERKNIIDLKPWDRSLQVNIGQKLAAAVRPDERAHRNSLFVFENKNRQKTEKEKMALQRELRVNTGLKDPIEVIVEEVSTTRFESGRKGIAYHR